MTPSALASCEVSAGRTAGRSAGTTCFEDTAAAAQDAKVQQAKHKKRYRIIEFGFKFLVPRFVA